MLNDTIKKLLEKKGFVYIATADLESRPNVAPKFLVKIDHSIIYLVDYVSGTTYNNAKNNPRAAISFMDNETLAGYLLRGTVGFFTSGEEFRAMMEELQNKQLVFTIERLIKGVQRGKRHNAYEAALPQNGVIFKFKTEEVVEIAPSGQLTREKV